MIARAKIEIQFLLEFSEGPSDIKNLQNAWATLLVTIIFDLFSIAANSGLNSTTGS